MNSFFIICLVEAHCLAIAQCTRPVLIEVLQWVSYRVHYLMKLGLNHCMRGWETVLYSALVISICSIHFWQMCCCWASKLFEELPDRNLMRILSKFRHPMYLMWCNPALDGTHICCMDNEPSKITLSNSNICDFCKDHILVFPWNVMARFCIIEKLNRLCGLFTKKSLIYILHQWCKL